MVAGRCRPATSPRITRNFSRLCSALGLVAVALLTLAPRVPCGPVRLACLIHAANVHSEPGSNPSNCAPGGETLSGPAPGTPRWVEDILTGRCGHRFRCRGVIPTLVPAGRSTVESLLVVAKTFGPRRPPSEVQTLGMSSLLDRPNCQRTSRPHHLGVPTPEAGLTRPEGLISRPDFATYSTSMARRQVSRSVRADVTCITSATRVNVAEVISLVNTLVPENHDFLILPCGSPSSFAS